MHILSLALANSKLSWSNRKTFCLLFVCPFTRKSFLWCGLGLPKVTSFYWSLELKVCQFETYYLIHLSKDSQQILKELFYMKKEVTNDNVLWKTLVVWKTISFLVTQVEYVLPWLLTSRPSFIWSWSIRHILKHELFCLGRLGSSGQ